MHITKLLSLGVLASASLSPLSYAQNHTQNTVAESDSHTQHQMHMHDSSHAEHQMTENTESHTQHQAQATIQNHAQHQLQNQLQPSEQAHQHHQAPLAAPSVLQAASSTSTPSTTSSSASRPLQHSSQNSADEHQHHKEHGGQHYQVTNLENAWSVDDNGHGTFSTQLKSMIGSDENRLYIKANLSKPESADSTYNVSAFYSRMLTDFWDGQLGVRYRQTNPNTPQLKQQDKVDAVLGFHGLAPYFFESDAHIYVGQDQYVALGLSFERDLLLTQKLITQPYIEADVVLSDDSDDAVKTGLSEWQVGVKTRYEINKQVKPFIDVGYSYEKGRAATAVQTQSNSESDWRYGVGLELVF